MKKLFLTTNGFGLPGTTRRKSGKATSVWNHPNLTRRTTQTRHPSSSLTADFIVSATTRQTVHPLNEQTVRRQVYFRPARRGARLVADGKRCAPARAGSLSNAGSVRRRLFRTAVLSPQRRKSSRRCADAMYLPSRSWLWRRR